ncbi:MAG: zinc-ribbon domain-containing protein [Eubacterium sp.]|nr:zinc-ribbon domain-containing protein [Eubacterium sp.]
MNTCPNCGTTVQDEINVCPNCGTILEEDQPVKEPADRYVHTHDPVKNYGSVEPYATGGLMAWSIITLLFCTIAGAVAIYTTTQINKAETLEEQQKKIKQAKIWCAVGTVLGVLAVIGRLAQSGLI